ncbi:MAG: hypothetical protein DRN91_08725 [Candidatus Alkanophagales archaeon]|nr:MAG: hypothetical protein DRN91_08725 [Candidatus Alkanophagales archaeon]
MYDISKLLYELVVEWGYLGALIVSILGNFIPFIRIPYLAAIFLVSSSIPELNPLVLGIVSGIGGGIGKLVTYYISRGANVLMSSEQLRRLNALKELIGNYGAIALFIFAATPSPDDVIIIILGVIGYDVRKFLLSCTAGKIVISILTAYSGRLFRELMEQYLGLEQGILPGLISIIFLIPLIILIIKVDWMKLLEDVNKLGWKECLRRTLRLKLSIKS